MTSGARGGGGLSLGGGDCSCWSLRPLRHSVGLIHPVPAAHPVYLARTSSSLPTGACGWFGLLCLLRGPACSHPLLFAPRISVLGLLHHSATNRVA